MLVAAVDLGASSVRVSVVDLSRRPLDAILVHRHTHAPIRHSDGSLRWDWSRLVEEVRLGLARAREHGPITSIGVDGWGLDYGLLDRRGALVAPPHSYRDDRLTGWEQVAERIGRRRLYDTTGIQLMAGNTIFQLAAHDRRELAQARHVLMLPELLLHELCGVVVAERTTAGTTALVDHRTGTWSDELLTAIDADPGWFPEIHPFGERVGFHEGVPVHLVSGHDTACAVLAMAPDPSPAAAFLSAGTLFLVGREQAQVRTDDACFERNLSNEPGAMGGVRLLGNLPGMWLLEECRRRWDVSSVAQLLTDLPPRPGSLPLVDVHDPAFVAPSDMPAEVRRRSGLPADADPRTIVWCIVESLAEAVAASVSVLDDLDPIDELLVIGGATRAQVLLDQLAERTGLPVRAGPAEATTLGNALAQGRAIGYFDDQAAARAALAAPA
ncbi:rhamnulokinase [Rhabdothermincola salaria]|uniref:rhamnulokinase n=1 Tax=Rhabdothermincola salaria TaxID=2903142 RepID=UPI001E3C410A|nr:FGGY-family carbohydrate kinase [Rhabdothermincola salaria]MCD9622408.1 hypothetical protein [Rhabdothermincola salaria]